MPRVLIVSNRLPITVRRGDQGFQVKPSAGGLATGLKGVHEDSGGLWIGWPGLSDDEVSEPERVSLSSRYDELRVAPVTLTADEVERYYEGFCNGILWPLFHYLMEKLPLEFEGFELYEAINRRFTDEICAHYRAGDIVWVHDYHLMLVPQMVRERIPEARIGYFLHIPFPSSDVFRTLPFRDQLLRGLLGADLIGFHTASYLRHFASTVLRTLGLATDGDTLRTAGRRVRLGVFPMGIDVATYRDVSARVEVEERVRELRAEGGQIVFGLDRLDYTKGIRRRLLAFETMLREHPELHGRVRLIQCASPSRTNVEAYQHFRREVEALVGRIVGTYATADWVPVHYIVRGLPFEEIVALYRAADVALVTPVRDGMNLVAKEFVATRADDDGVLVLSEFAGAASELAEAVLVNPFDVDGMASALHQALTMPERERRTRMRGLRERVMHTSVQSWAEDFLAEVAAKAETRTSRSAPTAEAVMQDVRLAIKSAPSLAIIVDYGGTLVPMAPTPHLARPSPRVHALLEALAARPNTSVHVVSGCDRDILDSGLSDLPITLHAEHGYWIRPPDEPGRASDPTIDLSWKPAMRKIMDEYCQRTPGARVEDKASGLAFHYRMVEPEFGAQQAGDLRLYLLEMFSNAPVEILAEDKIIEVRHQGVHKGRVVAHVLEHEHEALLVAIGDGRSDEDMFSALPDGAVSIRVGPGLSQAKYRLVSVSDVHALLYQLID
ncbi:bifunctional alpha,alpha-trehalose-phosphate synthase (UDP-forming)/trehalose-phosphatase [Haliangium sp.]|uniref:bifunctional alpha,alpha-trehalose-phosphate synthase (UDP-forming)/trehalose-phosphatase n=1 Tax=Haliangium sp. TaxID=2663208 RepID=UPI003D09F456